MSNVNTMPKTNFMFNAFIRLLALGVALCIGPTCVWAADAATPPTPELVLQLAHGGDVARAVFAGQNRLVTESNDGTLKWWNGQTNELLRTVPARQGMIYALCAAPDGALVVSGGETGGVKVWDARNGNLVRSLLEDSVEISALAFSADGSTLAAVSTNDETNEVVIWDAHNWREQRRFQIVDSTDVLALSADGALVAVGGRQPGKTGVWTTRDNKFLFAFDEQSIGESSNGINALAFLPPRTGDKFPVLATSSYLWGETPHSKIHLWNAATGEHLRVWLQTESVITNIAFSPSGDMLALRQQVNVNTNYNLQLWAVANATDEPLILKATLAVPKVNLGEFTFSPDGQRLASGSDSYQATAYVFDAQNGQLANQITALQNRNPISKVILSRGQLTTIGESSQLWDANKGTNTENAKVSEQKILSPDGQLFAEIYNTEVRIEDAKSGDLLRTLPQIERQQPQFLMFSPDSHILVTCENDFANENSRILLKLWDVQTGKRLQQLEIEGYYSSNHSDTIAFSPDSSALVVGNGTLVQVWDVKTGQMRAALHALVKGRDDGPIVFSPDGRRLAAAVRVAFDDTTASVIKVWDWPSGHLLWQLPDAGERATSLAFSADSSLLASGEKYGDIALWDMASGKLRQKWQGHLGAVNSVAFADDATDARLASGGKDSTAKLWNARNGELLATFQMLRDQWSEDDPEHVTREWIVYTPAGYYRASPQAAPFIRWRLGDELLPASAKTDDFNRPDLVAQALQNNRD